MSEGTDLEEYVFTCLETMYEGFQSQRSGVSDRDIVDLRYEDLVIDPVGELQRAYQWLGLDKFETVEPKLAAYAKASRSYQTNRYELKEPLRQRIADRWHVYFDAYGYDA